MNTKSLSCPLTWLRVYYYLFYLNMNILWGIKSFSYHGGIIILYLPLYLYKYEYKGFKNNKYMYFVTAYMALILNVHFICVYLFLTTYTNKYIISIIQVIWRNVKEKR